MPAQTAYTLGDDANNYEGVDFPLYCGIISVYPQEDKFVFTKTTTLPIRRLEEKLRGIEKNGFIYISSHHAPSAKVPVKSFDFASALTMWADSNFVLLFKVSNGQEIPLNVTPRFKRMCRFTIDKQPHVDCAHTMNDVKDLYIPFTPEEMQRIAKVHAK